MWPNFGFSWFLRAKDYDNIIAYWHLITRPPPADFILNEQKSSNFLDTYAEIMQIKSYDVYDLLQNNIAQGEDGPWVDIS